MRFSILLFFVALSTGLFSQTFRWNQETLTPEIVYDNEPAPTARASNNTTLAQPAEYNTVAAKQVEVGTAVYYADYLEGRSTALGEIYRGDQMTAAHRSYPLGTVVKVTRVDNGLSTIVRINDRGPHCDGCVIDLSAAAANEIDLMHVGRTRVSVQVVGQSDRNPPPPTIAAASNSRDFTARSVQAQPQSYDAVPTSRINTSSPVAESGSLTARSPVANPNQVNILANAPGGYVIQVGSYSDFGNAERHVISMQQKGFDQIFIHQEQKTDGQVLNRVIVAPFRSNSEAQAYLNELRDVHQIRGLIIKMR